MNFQKCFMSCVYVYAKTEFITEFSNYPCSRYPMKVKFGQFFSVKNLRVIFWDLWEKYNLLLIKFTMGAWDKGKN